MCRRFIVFLLVLQGFEVHAGEKEKLVKQLSVSLRDPEKRMAALLALLDAGNEAKSAVSDLINALPTATSNEKEVIVAVLGKIGPASEPAIPILVGFFDDKNGFLGIISAIALVNIGDKSLPFLVKPLLCGSDVAKQLACECCRLFGPKARPLGLFLIPCVFDSSPEVRSRAERAFYAVQFGKANRP